MHVDVETIIQPITSQNIEPQILENIHETQIPEQIPEQQIEMSQENPLSDLDASTIFNIEHNIPLSPISIETIPLDSPPTESDALIIHPLYKHLTMDEIVIPSDQILPILEILTRNSIDIENSSELIPASALRKITIKPLKHQKSSPKPKLPYKKPYNSSTKTLNQLLTSAIHISLTNFKSTEEDTLIFPSDINAEGETLKARMCDVIDSLGMYLKEKTKGKGMVVLNNMMDIDARVIPPRLTNSAGLDFEEQIIVRLVEKKIEEALKILKRSVY
jgi:hypothetical protein